MAKFKIGDKVFVDYKPHFNYGVYTVKSIRPGGIYQFEGTNKVAGERRLSRVVSEDTSSYHPPPRLDYCLG